MVKQEADGGLVQGVDEGPLALAAPAEDMATGEDPGSDTFEADVESVADQDQDIEMGES